MHPAGGTVEDRSAGAPPFDGPASLVHQSMVVATQQEAIIQARLPAVRPVDHVVRIAEAEPAAGKAAAAVANVERAPQPGTYRARLAHHVEDGPVVCVGYPHDRAVAAEPPRRFR